METSDSIINLLEVLSSENDGGIEESIFRDNKKNVIYDEEQNQKDNDDVESNYSSTESDVILSVFWKRGKLGAAYYNFESFEVRLLNDIIDVHPDFIYLKTLINQTEPSQIVTCGGLPDSFVKALHEAVDIRNFQPDESNRKVFFMSSKKRDLGYDACKRYILGSRFGFEPPALSEEDHRLFVNSRIELVHEAMVISFGILLKFLEKHSPQMTLNHYPVQILLLNQISLENLVSIDENTFKALQIFNPKLHPSAFKRDASSANKEGLSLFGIFNRCKSKSGMKRLKQIFMSPSKNIEEINNRLDAVEFFSQPQHQHVAQNLLECIKRVENVTGSLASIYRTRANIGHWKSLYSSLYNAILVGEICQKYSSKLLLFENVSKSITRNVHEVAHFMNQIIDFEESSARNIFTVHSGIHKKLDLLRQKHSQIPEVLIKVAEMELENLPEFIKRCSIIYITELGYLLSVPVWDGDGSQPSDYVLPNFELKFIVNNYIHYKTPRCAELDEVLGDSIAFMSDIESNIMITLIQFIYKRVDDIVNVTRYIAELDCVIALASIAAENNYRRPIVTNEKKLEIVEGRHPLQELCVDNFVSNNVEFGSDDRFIKILTVRAISISFSALKNLAVKEVNSNPDAIKENINKFLKTLSTLKDVKGPNSSGKSVFLKQVALIVYLTHIGSFVPAQKAVIGIFDHICSRIQSIESISSRISAFLTDLKQLSLSFYNSTPRSLIIIDEFGKGTTEVEGLSLFAASLQHFIEREKNCPYILVSTHFHGLASLLPPSPLIHLQFMEFVIENQEIIYLYKIKEGTCGSSLTHLAARAAGLTETEIERGLDILDFSKPLKPNMKLKVTKNMMRDIYYMEKIFGSISESPADKRKASN